MPVIPDEVADFLRGHRLAVMTTIRRDGQPQPTPVYYLFEDGRLLISTTRTRAKYKNLKRDDRVALCVLDERPPFDYATVYGRAQFIEDEGAVLQLSRRIWRTFPHYQTAPLPSDFAERMRRDQRLVITVTPEHSVIYSPPRR